MKRWISCILCAVLAFILSFFNIFGFLNQEVEDILYHSPKGTDNKIRIIKIDDKTMNRLGDFSKWDRSVYADLIETLCVSKYIRPAVIGFDILFTTEKDAKTDSEFVNACKEYSNVVTCFSYVFSEEIVENKNGELYLDKLSVQEKVVPFNNLREVTSQGFVNTSTSESKIRDAFLYFDEDKKAFKRELSFASAIYEKYCEEIKLAPSPYPTTKSIMTFRYSGKPGDYENVSLCDVLDGTVPPEAFDGCIVLVGVYASGMMDSYFVPVTSNEQMYGVEIHANILQAIMQGNTLTPIPAILDGIIAFIICGLLMLLGAKLGVVKTLILCVATAVAKLAIGFLLFELGFTFEHLTVPSLAILIAIYYTALHYYKARKAKLSIERAFSKYVAPQIISEIAKDGTYELKLGGENRDIAVFFVDIRGFTSLSETLAPEQVVDILNGYLNLTTRCIFRHGGTLDKFVGDATMAVFNSPFDMDDYVYKAVLAAWDIVQGGNKIEKEYAKRYGKNVGFGVGVNCGPAVVGNIGCDFRMDFTAIGDTVNTAARLEANAPRGNVYISDTVYERLKDRIITEDVGEIPLKGKEQSIFVRTIKDIKGYKSPEGE
ncbi:MAG: adenylate/guanylate cyclase domain-containing protein [Oscillospiraceae bacterium]|nr:adenylate/guanylate cyclase domain-containing protein [Oscillospiraceae bacterium]